MASPAEPASSQPAPGTSGEPVKNPRSGSLTAWLSVLAAAAIIAAVAAWLGAWWVPFLLGVVAGLRRVTSSWFWRGTTTAAVIGAIAGWLIPLWVLTLRGQPAGATARAIAGLAGLPPYAGVTIAVLALLAALQVWAGAWLARAVFPAGVLTSRLISTPGRSARPSAAEDPEKR